MFSIQQNVLFKYTISVVADKANNWVNIKQALKWQTKIYNYCKVVYKYTICQQHADWD